MATIVSPNMSTGYNQISSASRAQAPVQGNDMLALIAQMLQAQQQQQQSRAAMQREALNAPRRGMSGGIIDPTTGQEAGNPFNNGFFLSPQARMDKIGASWNAQAPQAPPTLRPNTQLQSPSNVQTIGNPDLFGLNGPQGKNQRILHSPYGTGSSKLGPTKKGSAFGFT
jgi:hypothetical protein